MSSNKLASQLKAQIEEIKAKGRASISCDVLIDYLGGIERGPDGEPSAYELEMRKAALRDKTEADNRTHQSMLEGFRTVISLGQNAIKTSFILHGGAAITLIALIGHLSQQERTMKYVPKLAECIMPFSVGVFLVSLVSCTAYICQWFYEKHDQCSYKIAYYLNWACIVISGITLVVFIWGIAITYYTLAQFP